MGKGIDNIEDAVESLFTEPIERMIISKTVSKDVKYKKIVVEQKSDSYQLAKYTDRQVFHENVDKQQLKKLCIAYLNSEYMQINGFCKAAEIMIMVSKKGKVLYKKSKNEVATKSKEHSLDHNRKKNYILGEGEIIPPLVDMGVFTKEGKVVNAMYDKYKQINRFIEIIDDVVKKKEYQELNIIDFGCGKSYLTFILYHYLTNIRKIKVNMIGLDLKADVIMKCNMAAQKYNYTGLRFELGNINGYKCPFKVDMVITLHACDTATDFALANAVEWGTEMIFSVPCCQHELNSQISSEQLGLFERYGIISERFCALATDAIRANVLEYVGYNTQLLEFIDLEHTPKNILIRAVKNDNKSKEKKEKMLKEIEAAMETFSFRPTIYNLLIEK